jgi:hypothetical protein
MNLLELSQYLEDHVKVWERVENKGKEIAAKAFFLVWEHEKNIPITHIYTVLSNLERWLEENLQK